MAKITVIGAGNVGATCAQRIVEKAYADVVLLDIIEGLPQGKALDILESSPIINFNSRVTGTNDYRDTAGSDVVVITSGLGRKPGMSREDLLLANRDIVSAVVRNVVSHSPDCIIIMVTNPVDAMTYLALRISSFPSYRVFGLSGVLDSARLRTFVAAALNVPVADVAVYVLGEHGKNMIVIPRLCTVKGTPITRLLPPDRVNKLVERTVNAGAEVIGLLKAGGAFYAPSAAVAQMVESVVLDKKQVLPCAAYLNGEYGFRDTVIGVPVKLGKQGIEEIIELDLTSEEKARLASSAEAVRELIRAMKLG
ncbi:MAG: malate dehydrogenase [Chloroflexi bacterium]|nr:malate dehydrogenase [Chloroflexota bacterium]